MNGDQLFFKIWRNVYLKYIIFQFIKLYKNNRHRAFDTLGELIEYKDVEYIQSLVYRSKELLIKGNLPTNGILNELILKSDLLNKIRSDAIPNSVTKIHFSNNNYSHCQCISLNDLPTSVTSVYNYHYFTDSPITIPPNIKLLSFSNQSTFKNSIIFKDPGSSNLTTLILHPHWNNAGNELYKDYLPNSLLEFSAYGYLKKLKVGDLPNSITNLSISFPNDYTIDSNVLPNNLKSLIIWSKFSKGLKISKDSSCANSLTILQIETNFSFELEPFSIPPSLKSLKLYILIYDGEEDRYENNPFSISNQQLFNCRNSLESLEIISNKQINFDEKDVLLNLTSLSNFSYFSFIEDQNDSLEEMGLLWPESLTTLKLGLSYQDDYIQSKPLKPNVLPPNLKTLILEENNQPFLKGTLPQSLTYLDTGYNWNNSLEPGILPNNLITLVLSKQFSQDFTQGSLPQSLTDLQLGFNYLNNHPIDISILPPALKYKFKQPKCSNTNINILLDSIK